MPKQPELMHFLNQYSFRYGIDLDKRPVLANQVGGLSGPAIKPIGVRMVGGSP